MTRGIAMSDATTSVAAATIQNGAGCVWASDERNAVMRARRVIGWPRWKPTTAAVVAALLLMAAPGTAQAPAALLKDAEAEYQAAAKALNESEVFQRFQRSKRILDGLKAWPTTAPETGSK